MRLLKITEKNTAKPSSDALCHSMDSRSSPRSLADEPSKSPSRMLAGTPSAVGFVELTARIDKSGRKSIGNAGARALKAAAKTATITPTKTPISTKSAKSAPKTTQKTKENQPGFKFAKQGPALKHEPKRTLKSGVMLNQAGVQAGGPPKKPGRPKKDEHVVKRSISVDADTHDYLVRVGAGSLSAGVRLTAQWHQESTAHKPSAVFSQTQKSIKSIHSKLVTKKSAKKT
jgi:hypothetical protein